ncbi:MAG TPA: DUF1206 domain-containing protein [Mycobacteriales bacterium]|nr:DUF1206 domain-containing protein [Mycobacteriales bacterium]
MVALGNCGHITAMATTAASRRRRTAHGRAADPAERVATVIARFGLVARGCFYLLLAGLVVNLAVTGRRGPQADANGALTTIASNPIGEVAIVAVAVGFLGFGVVRLWSAWTDRRGSRWRRITTGLQGAFYLALAWIPLGYVLGNRSTGSNQSQHRTAGDLLSLPAGREIVVGLGVVVIAACANQIRTAVSEEYADGLAVDRAPRWVCRLVAGAAVVGIPARALVFVPVGVFLIVAAVQSDPAHAEGLDQVLARLTGRWWGDVLLAVVAAGLLVFATYSFLEARYRKVTRAQ